MKFKEEAMDLGAPEYCVAGVSSVERISRNMIRVTYFTRRRESMYEVCSVVWDKVEWQRFSEMIEQARESILSEPVLSGDDDHPSRAAH